MKLLHVLFATVYLTGCAQGPLDRPGTFLPTEQHAALEQAALCCSSYREMRFVNLARGTEFSTAITTESPVFEFEKRRAYFAAFELPRASKVLIVKTYPVNMLWNATGHVLIPGVQFLDDKYEPVATLYPDFAARRPQFVGRSWAEVQIPVPSAARFVAIFGTRGATYLAWRDSDNPTGYLSVTNGPTGEVSVFVPAD